MSRAKFRLILLLAACAALFAACSSKNVDDELKPRGIMTATPNPIKVCDGSGIGVTTISCSSPPGTLVEIHVGAPDGGTLARLGTSGSATTGKWVTDGTVFYLQDVTDSRPLTPENTLASVTVRVTTQGCP